MDTTGASIPAQARSVPSEPTEWRNGTAASRALWLSDGTSAAWYILTIIGIYSVIFLFRLASNILRRNDRVSEDVYYSSVTSGLPRKELRRKGTACSSLTISNTAALQSSQSSPNAGPQAAPGAARPGDLAGKQPFSEESSFDPTRSPDKEAEPSCGPREASQASDTHFGRRPQFSSHFPVL